MKKSSTPDKQRIIEVRKPIDSPRIAMDFSNAVPGIYEVTLTASTSISPLTKAIKFRFNIHCPEDPRWDTKDEFNNFPFKI